MMQREIGDKSFPIWLLGDSNPAQWQNELKTPFDPRHPIRHNIWTPILDEMQNLVFRTNCSRIETKHLYIRNAVDDVNKKPIRTELSWPSKVNHEIEELRSLIQKHKPVFILCFGAFSFEFSRRALGENPQTAYGAWGAQKLGAEFRQRIEKFQFSHSNILPLLHRSIAGGRFLQSHNYYCVTTESNYFQEVGISIAKLLIQYQQKLPIWVENNIR